MNASGVVDENISSSDWLSSDELTVQEAASSDLVAVFNSIDPAWSDRSVSLPASTFDALLPGELDQLYAVARK